MASTSTASSSTTRIFRPMAHLPSRYARALTEASTDIIFGFSLRGPLEEIDGRRVFDQVAAQEKARVLRHARRLLHVVRHDHDGVVLDQLDDQFLDFERGDGVERSEERR